MEKVGAKLKPPTEKAVAEVDPHSSEVHEQQPEASLAAEGRGGCHGPAAMRCSAAEGSSLPLSQFGVLATALINR
jgi:hypothetical protein